MRGCAVLEIRNLRKTFGSVVAVDDVSFAVEPGRLTGLLGPNGAGKTTTVSMIAGLLTPDRGSVLGSGISRKTERIGNYQNLSDSVYQCGRCSELNRRVAINCRKNRTR